MVYKCYFRARRARSGATEGRGLWGLPSEDEAERMGVGSHECLAILHCCPRREDSPLEKEARTEPGLFTVVSDVSV